MLSPDFLQRRLARPRPIYSRPGPAQTAAAMDPVTLTYYGAICGLLSLAAPRFGHGLRRFALGIAVGLLAAAALPALRRALGL